MLLLDRSLLFLKRHRDYRSMTPLNHGVIGQRPEHSCNCVRTAGKLEERLLEIPDVDMIFLKMI
jgi:hypothetical protein